MNSPLQRPFIKRFYQPMPQRIFANVLELLFVLGVVSDSSMKGSALPFAGPIRMCATELVLPKRNPGINPEIQVVWRAEEVDMIGHEEIIPHSPGVCLVSPNAHEIRPNGCGPKARLAVFGIDGNEEDIRLPKEDVCTACWCLAPDATVTTLASCHERGIAWYQGKVKT